MRKFLILPTLFLLVNAAPSQVKEILYFVDFCSFYDQAMNPYAEAYLNLDASSLTYAKGSDGKWSASAIIQYTVISKADSNGTTVYDKKVELLTGNVNDTTQAEINFFLMDIKRIALSPGTYEFHGSLIDKNYEGGVKHQFTRDLIIDAAPPTPSFSDIEFVSAYTASTDKQIYTKFGHDIIPLITNGSFLDADTLGFYVEFYNTSKVITDGLVMIHCYVTPANSLEKLEKYQFTGRQQPGIINNFHHVFDISSLPTQTYYLNIELYNRENKVVSSTAKKFFVSNSRVAMQEGAGPQQTAYDDYFGMAEKELDGFLGPMRYIATSTEQRFLESLKTFEEKQTFFLNFWEKRRSGPDESPVIPFNMFKYRVNFVNQNYRSAFQPGWRTDRGRIMISYGAPNNIDPYPSDNSRYPYFVWTYNKLETQSGVIFVFYEPQESNNEFPLLHSTMFGELNNPRWKLELLRRNLQNNDLDKNSYDDNPDGFRR